MNIKNFFSEARRITSQFFETEFFYRWRKISFYHKNKDGKIKKSSYMVLEHLNNTWDLDKSILDIVEDKIFHAYVNIRRYGDTQSRYLHLNDILEHGNRESINWAFYKQFCMNDEKETKFCIKCGDTNITFLKTISDDFLIKVADWDNDIWVYNRPSIRMLLNTLHKIGFKDIIEKNLFFNRTIDVDVTDYKYLGNLKDYLQGRIITLHQIYQFRKMIRKLKDFDDTPENLEEEKRIFCIQEADKRKSEYDNFEKTKMNRKKDFARKIADFWVEKSPSWWD